MSKYTDELSKLAGLITAFGTKIVGDTELQEGERYIELQQLMSAIAPTQKKFKKLEDKIKGYAKENLLDNGSGESDNLNYFGANVSIKYVYPKPKLDAGLLEVELERAYAEIGTEYDKEKFMSLASPRQIVRIQSQI